MADRKAVLRRATRAAARRRGIDPDIFERQLGHESNFDENAVSHAGARGVAQFMPATAKGMGVDLNDGRALDDIDGAARLMASYLRKYGNWKDALTAYNAGPGRVGNDQLPAETINYISRILDGKNPKASGKENGKSAVGLGSVKKGTPPRYEHGAMKTDEDAALVDALLSGKGNILQAALHGIQSGQYTTQGPGKWVGGKGAEYVPGEGEEAASSSRGGGKKFNIRELFWNGDRAVNVDDNRRVPKGYVSGHTDHVHVAVDSDAARREVLKLVAKHGLQITSEGGGKHAPGSYHYQRTKRGKSRGIDIGGDPKRMAAFAADVARRRKS
jgi:hypothetical protein